VKYFNKLQKMELKFEYIVLPFVIYVELSDISIRNNIQCYIIHHL